MFTSLAEKIAIYVFTTPYASLTYFLSAALYGSGSEAALDELRSATRADIEDLGSSMQFFRL